MCLETLREVGEGRKRDIDLSFFDLGYFAVVQVAAIADLAQAEAFVLPDLRNRSAEFLF